MGLKVAPKVGAILFLLVSEATVADALREPLWIENLSPLQSVIAIPPQGSAEGIEGVALTLHNDLATHFIARQTDDEAVLFDGETQRTSLGLRWRFSPQWEISARLPVLRHSGGFTDSYVNQWHDFFSMSDGGRSAVSEDQLQYQYQAPGRDLSLTSSSAGVGDVAFEVSRLASQSAERKIAYVLGYEAATGSARDWLGNGGVDWYALTRVSGQGSNGLPIYWHAQLGATRPAVGGFLATNSRSLLWFGGLSGEWVFDDRWSLVAQLDGHQSAFQSSLDAVGKSALMVGLGLRRQFAKGWAADIGFVEDIRVETAPDIISQATIRYRPD
ncbi:MAG: DUF3187 family protein [Luminiphilus sp.]|nr:DUF3187 family protein [Luminiphilus sp.]